MIIGLNGKKESGKDTVADYLAAKHGFDKIGFADEMYRGICALFGIDLETAHAWKNSEFGIKVEISGLVHDVKLEYGEYTWREFLQRFGTDMARHIWGEDFWVDRLEKAYLTDGDTDMLVIKDVRYDNEAEMIRDHGGTVWEILRPGYNGDGHESEAGISEHLIDGELSNDASIEELHEMLDWWIKEISGG